LRRVTGHLTGSFLVAFGFAVAMMGTTLPTPLYLDLAGARGKQHATLLAVAANIGGLALGPLVAGLLAGLARRRSDSPSSSTCC
jgi:heme A synthase